MQYLARRPGHRPGTRHRRRGTTLLCLLALSVGLIYLRSNLNLMIYEASTEFERSKSSVELLERQVDGLRVEIDRSTDIARLGPRARRLGLAPPTPECVSLLPASSVLVSKGARPLLGAGALGRLVSRAAVVTRAIMVNAAEAPEARSLQSASASAQARCKHCRATGS